MKIRKCTLLIILLSACYQVYPQYSDFKYKKKNHSSDAWHMRMTKESRYIAGGAGINLLAYFGDLTPREKIVKNAFKVIRPGASLFGSYHFSNLFGVKADLFYGRITGDDFNTSPYLENSSRRKYVRNLSFRNDLIGLSLHGMINILSDPFEYYKRRDYNAYLMAGITIFYSNPKAKVPETFENAGDWVALRPLGTEGQNHPDIGGKYSPIQIGIPFGMGIRIRLSHRMDLHLEGSLTYILSDYIDDIGNSYVDLGAIESELGKALSDRSKEEKAVIKGEIRDQVFIEQNTKVYEYISKYDNQTYTVFESFGHENGLRGGSRNDLVGIGAIKISYIFTN